MSWRGRLLPASFAGKGFKVLSSSVTGGRRIHEWEKFRNADAAQERTITQDMGPILPKFEVEAYIVQNPLNGNDYFSERDALIKALNKYNEDGALLVHPFYGALKCHAGPYTVTESFEEGGIARFRITFLLEESSVFPVEISDFNTAMATQALSTIARASDGFFNAFDTAQSFVDTLGGIATFAIQRMQQSVTRVNGVISSTVQTALGVMTAALALIDTVLDSPCDLFNTMKSAVDGFRNIVGLAGEVVEGGIVGGCSGEERSAGRSLDGETIPEQLGVSTVDQLVFAQDFDESDLPSVTEGQTDNRSLLINIIKLMLLSLASEVAIRTSYKDQDKMFYVLNKLADAIEALLIRLGEQTTLDTNDMFIAVEELRALLFSSLIQKGAGLKRTVDYEVPNGVITTLNVAYDLYKDIDREEEIYDRNEKIARHPGFLPSGDIMKVLES